MKVKIPVEIDVHGGGVIVTEVVLEAGQEDVVAGKQRDAQWIRRAWKNKKVGVVVVVHDDPRSAVECLESVHDRTPVWVDKEVVVVNNASDGFTSRVVHDLFKKGLADEVINVFEYAGHLPAMQIALDESDADWLVYVDQHVAVTEGWIEKMMGAASSRPDVAMVVPWSTKRFPPPPGSNYVDLAERVERCSQLTRHEVALPGGWCLLVDRQALVEAGGWDVGNYGPGYGEVAELYMRCEMMGRVAVRADDCVVLDRSPGASEAEEWMPRAAGYMRFTSRWGRRAEKAYQARAGKDRPDELAKAAAVTRTSRPALVFVFREAPVCGLVLAAVNVCNEMVERGWNATFACTKLEPGHWKHMPAKFTPMVFQNEQDMVRQLPARMREGAAVATTWSTAKIVQAVAGKNVAGVYYVQDDERKFTTPSGAYVNDAKDVEASFGQVENLVANSDWVEAMLRELGYDPGKILIGVDSLRFHPGDKGTLPRVMAHCRPSTPRRGWTFIRDVLNVVSGAVEAEIVTYDEDPEGLNVRRHGHLGRVGPDELSRHMSRAHVFFEGSERQGFGMQALEAMACGCALVCSDNYGIRTFGTGGKDCVVVPHGDVGRAAATVKKLVEDAGQREILGRNARTTAEKLDWSCIARGWDEYLRRLS